MVEEKTDTRLYSVKSSLKRVTVLLAQGVEMYAVKHSAQLPELFRRERSELVKPCPETASGRAGVVYLVPVLCRALRVQTQTYALS